MRFATLSSHMHSHSIEPPFDEDVHDFYRVVLVALQEASIPFLLGGGYALRHWTGIARDSKDLDIFVTPENRPRALEHLESRGFLTKTPFPHWLSKVYEGDRFIDVIFNSGNGLTKVDDDWFVHAAPGRFLGIPVKVCPAEETLWSKAFVLERERCDAADVAHIILSRGANLDWSRLLRRFGDNSRVLFAHLVLFGFVYPGERSKVPDWVMERLWEQARQDETVGGDVCRGTLLSREQYLIDLERLGFKDARTELGTMRPSQVDLWTAAIADSRTG
ncbi:MAG: nucleotidyltransferase family protein [Polyangiales bacterium]